MTDLAVDQSADSAGGWIWYELMTTDVPAAKAFYDAVVSWEIGAQSVSPEQDYRMIGRADGGNAGGVLGLTPAMCEGGASPAWLGYLHVADVDAALAAIQADGGTVQMPATDMPGVGRIAMVADPQGAPVYLMAPAPPPGMEDAKSDVFSVDQPQRVRWNELSTSDPAAAIAFYRRHFGWAQEGEMDMGALGKYQFLQHDGVGIGAVMPLMPGSPGTRWTFHIGVDDIDRAHRALTAGGGIVIQGPDQIPGGEWSITAVDPQGAAFGLVGPRNA